MDPLSISASITALLQLTSTVVQYLNGVKGAPEERGRVLSELASVNSTLFILQEQADQAKLGDDWSSTLQSLNVPEGPLDHFRRALERLSSKLAPPATPLKKLGKAIAWPFQKEEIKEILGSIERQKALLILARQNDHIKLAKGIREDLTIMKDGASLMHNELQEITKGVSRLQMSEMTDKHVKILKWLDGPDPSTNYNKALKDRNSKTGSWFLKSRAYADWENKRGSFLWLHGIPGCGKTILSSTILQNVLDQHSTTPKSAVLFFYFDFNDAEKQRHEKMIRSLLCQLSKYCGSSVLQDLYSSCSDGSRQPTEEVLLNTLHSMMPSLGDIYIILDALDECAEREELLMDLKEIISWEGVSLHVLATSRRERDIEDELITWSDSRNWINIQSTLVDADIRTYIHDRLQVDRKLRRWQRNQEMQLEIENTLMEKADGMFRWVACQLDLLGDCFNVSHLRRALESLPKTLDDTYARILSNIDKQYNQYNQVILKVLQWLTFSAGPLQLQELAEIVAIDVDENPRFDPERRWPEPQDILTICSSLITLNENFRTVSDEERRSGSSEEERSNDFSEKSGEKEMDYLDNKSDSKDSKVFVRLAHFSVKEYLVSDRMKHGMAAHYSIQEVVSNGVIAEDCIAYLLQFDKAGSLTPQTLESSPLARYAAQNWTSHARRAEKGPIETTILLSTELLMSDGGLLSWFLIRDPDTSSWENWGLKITDLAPLLYYASQAGLFGQVKLLIEKNMDVNAQGGEYGNALQAASYVGNYDIVQVLLDNGADVNAQGEEYGNALIAASFSGIEKTVELLLDKGADINARGPRGNVFQNSNALQTASWRGRENVVKVLLDKGANVNALLDGDDETALQLASINGNANIVKMLLDKGADINALGPEGNTLQLASIDGNANTVKMLLDNGADINARGPRGNALQLASERGRHEVVKVLLDNGADINTLRDGDDETALQLALINGNANIVKMLLDKGADINVTDLEGFTALQLASINDNTNIVKILLDNGADINALGPEGFTALQLALFDGNANIAKILLDNGADINAHGPRGNALQLASSDGNTNIVKMLLDKGADINVTDLEGFTALQLASINGNANIVKMLLDNGADINALGPEGFTALQLASINSNANIVKILLDNGADINAHGPRGNVLQLVSSDSNSTIVKMLLDKGADYNALGSKGNALQLASFDSNTNIVKILLDNGADINAHEPRGNALQLASSDGNANIVKMLLDKGADINVTDPEGFTALQLASERGHKNIVDMLLAKGADINVKDPEGFTALQLASERGHKNIVDMLLAKGAVMPGEHGEKSEEETDTSAEEYEASDEEDEVSNPEQQVLPEEHDGDLDATSTPELAT